jgi:hypothetical protein
MKRNFIEGMEAGTIIQKKKNLDQLVVNKEN